MRIHRQAYGFRGQYQTITGICWGVDAEVNRTIQVDRKTIDFDNILCVENADGIFSRSWEQEYPEG